jgi:hypothetical protein
LLALITPDRLDKRRVGWSFLKDKRHVSVSPFGNELFLFYSVSDLRDSLILTKV